MARITVTVAWLGALMVRAVPVLAVLALAWPAGGCFREGGVRARDVCRFAECDASGDVSSDAPDAPKAPDAGEPSDGVDTGTEVPRHPDLPGGSEVDAGTDLATDTIDAPGADAGPADAGAERPDLLAHVTTGVYIIASAPENLCNRLPVLSNVEGATIETGPCDAGLFPQRWQLHRLRGAVFQIRSASNGKCMTAAADVSGGYVRQQRCIDDTPAQQWRIDPRPDTQIGDYTVHVVSESLGLCLRNTQLDGSVARLSACGATGAEPGQLLRLLRAPPAIAQISFGLRLLHSQKCLQIEDPAAPDGGRAVQRPCSSSDYAQSWSVRHRQDALSQIASQLSGECLAVVEGVIRQRPCATAPRWVPEALGAGMFRLASPTTDRCLAIEGGSIQDGAPAIEEDCGETRTPQMLVLLSNSRPLVPARQTFRLRLAGQPSCVTLNGGAALGASLSACNDLIGQAWTLTPMASDIYRLTPLGSTCVGGSTLCARELVLVHGGGSAVSLRGLASERCLTRSASGGAALTESSCDPANPDQLFTFEPTGATGLQPRQLGLGETAEALPARYGAPVRCFTQSGAFSGPVWGTDVYASTSSICAAAMHAGLPYLDEPSRGVLLTLLPGAPVHIGSVQHGVTSQPLGSAPTSFRFPEAGTWATTAQNLAHLPGESFGFGCPRGGMAAPIWGTGVYDVRSSVCTAAAHAGRINPLMGGSVGITIGPAPVSYAASAQNGVTSGDTPGPPADGVPAASFTLVPGP